MRAQNFRPAMSCSAHLGCACQPARTLTLAYKMHSHTLPLAGFASARLHTCAADAHAMRAGWRGAGAGSAESGKEKVVP